MDSLAWLGGAKPKDIDLYVIKPKYLAPHIIYQFPEDIPVTIEGGVSYTLIPTINYLLGTYDVYWQSVFNILEFSPWTGKYAVVGIGQQLQKVRITNGIPFGLSPGDSGIWSNASYNHCVSSRYRGILYYDNQGILRNSYNEALLHKCIFYTERNFQAPDYQFTAGEITDIVAIDPSTVEQACKIDIYDKDGILIHTDQKEGECPSVVVNPESCYYEYSEQQFLTTIHQSTPTIQFNITTKDNGSRKCTVVERYLYDPSQDLKPPGPLDPILATDIMEEICSDENCELYPLICFSCDDDDGDCEECPTGTAYQVLDGNILLCVGIDGCILTSIPYDPKCHRIDCQC